MARKELIPKVLDLDKKLAAKLNLPSLFHGKTPQNSLSGRLTTNNNKHFVCFVPPGSSVQHFKLAFTPGDFASALNKYTEWTDKLINLDWPWFFEKQFERTSTETRNETTNLSTKNSAEMILSDAADSLTCESVSLSSCETNNTEQYILPHSLDELFEKKTSTIPNAGFGLFARLPIPKSTYLGFYFGVPMAESDFDAVKEGVGVASRYVFYYRNNVLDPTDDQGVLYDSYVDELNCPFLYINEDQKKPNVAFIEGSECNQIICVSIQDISPGEELFVNYGKGIDRYWEASGSCT
jgi:hypothetical protein